MPQAGHALGVVAMYLRIQTTVHVLARHATFYTSLSRMWQDALPLLPFAPAHEYKTTAN